MHLLTFFSGFYSSCYSLPRINDVSRRCKSGDVKSEKLMTLKEYLKEKIKLHGIEFRSLVFVKQRISAYVLSECLNRDENCCSHGLRAG